MTDAPTEAKRFFASSAENPSAKTQLSRFMLFATWSRYQIAGTVGV